MQELPFPVYHFSPSEIARYRSSLERIACTLRYNRAAEINFDKETRRHRDNSRGVSGGGQGTETYRIAKDKRRRASYDGRI